MDRREIATGQSSAPESGRHEPGRGLALGQRVANLVRCAARCVRRIRERCANKVGADPGIWRDIFRSSRPVAILAPFWHRDCGLSSRLDAPHWRRCNAPQSYGATAKKYNSACGCDKPCPSPCARSHHRTSIRPALADILTPLNGLYMTSPSTLS